MQTKNIKNLPYRDNVCCVVFKGKKFLLVQNLGFKDDWWKFPQGGIKENERAEEAAKRELEEEIGNKNFNIIGKSSYTNQFDWSDKSLKLAGYRWRGQIQQFFLIEYTGNEKEIRINKKETQRYKWVDLEEMFVSIDHDGKDFANYKETIEKVLSEFGII